MAKAKKVSKKNKSNSSKKDCNISCGSGSPCGGAGYGLGFLGAVIYYISTAGSFWMGFLGILKAMVWPAFLVFELLKYLGA